MISLLPPGVDGIGVVLYGEKANELGRQDLLAGLREAVPWTETQGRLLLRKAGPCTIEQVEPRRIASLVTYTICLLLLSDRCLDQLRGTFSVRQNAGMLYMIKHMN